MSYEKNFLALGKAIPPDEPTVPAGCNFVLYRTYGKILQLSGYGPFWGATVPDNYTGVLGKNIDVPTGYKAAQLTGINLLLMARQCIQTLDNVVQVIEVNGFVNCIDGFTQQPDVINGCSDLMVQVFGDHGRHTRSAIGSNALARGICVEISMSLQIRD